MPAIARTTRKKQAPDVDAIICEGEIAVGRYTKSRDEACAQIIPMARGLLAARRKHTSNQAFGVWLNGSPYSDINRTDRAALINIGEDETILAPLIAAGTLISPHRIWEEHETACSTRLITTSAESSSKPVGHKKAKVAKAETRASRRAAGATRTVVTTLNGAGAVAAVETNHATPEPVNDLRSGVDQCRQWIEAVAILSALPAFGLDQVAGWTPDAGDYRAERLQQCVLAQDNLATWRTVLEAASQAPGREDGIPPFLDRRCNGLPAGAAPDVTRSRRRLN